MKPEEVVVLTLLLLKSKTGLPRTSQSDLRSSALGSACERTGCTRGAHVGLLAALTARTSQATWLGRCHSCRVWLRPPWAIDITSSSHKEEGCAGGGTTTRKGESEDIRLLYTNGIAGCESRGHRLGMFNRSTINPRTQINHTPPKKLRE